MGKEFINNKMTDKFFTVLVCGGRKYNNQKNVFDILDDVKQTIENNNNILNDNMSLKIVNGGAKGADDISTKWAKQNNIYIDIFMADWKTHGVSAGPIRNRLMFETSKPNIIIAFNGGPGTKNMIELALRNQYIKEDLTEDKECQILYQA